MTFGNAIAIYIVIWWTTIFAVLPFGIRSQLEAKNVVPGSDPGAPSVARMATYFAANSVIAGAIFAFFYFVIYPQM